MVDSDATLSADGGPRVDEPRIAKATILDDRYEIIEELGRGAYGIVYRARDAIANTEVAIKVLDRAARPTVERLSRELRAAWTVTHPGVVRIHDVIQLGGDRLALSMELVDGETLTAHLARHGPLPIPRLVALARGLADALAAAHEAGVVHRDLKPSNIMIRRDGRPVISDFGLSRVVGTQPEAAAMLAANGCDVTRSGDLVGTPSFMAPEQLRGEATVGPAADMYAIGLVLYEAATGERLHAATTLPELVRDRIARPAPPVASKRAEVPAALARAIDDCLRIAVAERLPDGRALVERLAPRRRRWPIVAGITCAVLAAAALVLFVVRGSHRPELPAVTFATPPSGPVQWSATIPGTTAGIVQRAVRMPNGVRYLAGHTTTGFRVGDDVVPLQDGHHSGYVIAVAPDGAIAWHREVTGAKQAQLVDMVVANGLVLVAGNHHGQFDLGDGVVIAAPHQGALFDCYVAAFDAATGAPRWAVSVGGSYLCQVHGLVGDDAGNVYLGGELGGSASFGKASPVVHASSDVRGVFVASFTAAGELRWVTAATGMTQRMQGLAIASGGGAIVLGGSVSGRAMFGGRELVGEPAGDGFVALLDPATGSVRSTRAFSSSGYDAVRALAVDGTGAIAVGGLLSGRLELGDLPPVVAVGQAAFIAMLAPDLTPRWVVSTGSDHYQDVRALAFGPDALYAVGRFDEGLAFGDRHLAGSGGYVLALGRDGGTRSLLHLDAMLGTRQRTVSIDRDGTIGVTGTFRSDIGIAGATIPGPITVTNGYAIELRPPVQGDGR